MIEVIATADVPVPPEEAFSFVADMSNNPRWQRGMRSCVWTTEPPIRVGSTYEQRARFLSRDIVSSFEVVEFQPGCLIRIRTTGGTMPLDITREVEGIGDGGARITATIRGGPTGPLRWFDPLTRRLVRRSVRGDYARLEQLLSAGAPS